MATSSPSPTPNPTAGMNQQINQLAAVTQHAGIDPSVLNLSGVTGPLSVWFPYTPLKKGAKAPSGGLLGAYQPQQSTGYTMPLSQAKELINNWDHQDLQLFAQSLYAKGIIPAPVVNMQQLRTVWEQMVSQAADFKKAGRDISPYDVLSMYMEQPPKDGPGANGGVRSQTTLFDPGAAASAIDELLQQRLGRSATDGEKKAFVSALNAAMTQNPTVVSTDANGNTVTQQGADASAFADNYVKEKFGSEAGTYQAATTYFDVFEKLLGGPSSGVV